MMSRCRTFSGRFFLLMRFFRCPPGPLPTVAAAIRLGGLHRRLVGGHGGDRFRRQPLWPARSSPHSGDGRSGRLPGRRAVDCQLGLAERAGHFQRDRLGGRAAWRRECSLPDGSARRRPGCPGPGFGKQRRKLAGRVFRLRSLRIGGRLSLLAPGSRPAARRRDGEPTTGTDRRLGSSAAVADLAELEHMALWGDSVRRECRMGIYGHVVADLPRQSLPGASRTTGTNAVGRTLRRLRGDAVGRLSHGPAAIRRSARAGAGLCPSAERCWLGVASFWRSPT